MIRSRNRARGFSGGGAAPWYTEGKADGVDPSLWADFVNNRYAVNGVEAPFADVFTYTRASTATYFDASGVLQTASANTPRFDYDPVTHDAKGILIEESRTNLLLRSSEFENAVWGKRPGITVTPNTTTAPDGTLTADTFTNGAMIQGDSMGEGIIGVIGQLYTFSVWMKTNTTTTAGISLGRASNNPTVIQSVNLTNQWQRFSISWTLATNTTLYANIYSPSINNTLYIWGAQLEAGSFPTSYIPTTTAAVTRAADQCSNTSSNVITPSSWMSSTAHTLYTERTHTGSVDGNSIYLGNSAGNNLFMQNYYFLNNQFFVVDNLVAQASWLVGTQPVNTPYKRASSGQANDYTDYRNGVSLGTDASGTMPLFDRLVVADANANAAHVKELRYYPIRVTNSELARITT